MSEVAIVPGTLPMLAPLAAAIGQYPLFARYGQTSQSLAKRWARALHDGDGLLVALHQDVPAGLAWFCLHGGFGAGAYLRLLAVAPAMRRRAVGVALLQAFETACSNASGGFFLLCSDFNSAAQAFYGTSGYREVGRLPEFAASGVTEIIFWKPFCTSPPILTDPRQRHNV